MAVSGPIAELDWIAVDWGTSTLRVWAIDKDGAVLAKASSDEGMRSLMPHDYEPTLLRIAGDWIGDAREEPVCVIVCGMAGAEQGWTEAAYRTVPCAPLAGGRMTPVRTCDARLSVSIVPGLCQADPADVMRGEETQLAGLLARVPGDDVTVCMPGTHSKWVRIEAGCVTEFKTVMTGELFSVIASHTILRHSVASREGSAEVFLGAVRDMLDRPDELTAALFSIRASDILDGTCPEDACSRLSGLLIGAELAATRTKWEEGQIHLVGAGQLAAAYATALESAGARPIVEDAETLTLAGLVQACAMMRDNAP
jgi:2-dehydro-3-deoxygalactonokinase